MKTNLLSGWKWSFTLGVALALLGCVDKTKGTDAKTPVAETVVSNPTPTPPASESEPAPLRAIIPPANLSPGIPEVVKLAQSGVGEEVLLAYVHQSGRTFNPSVDEIVYLKDLGLSESVLAALVAQNVPAIPAPAPPIAAAPETNVAPAFPAAPSTPAPSIAEAPAPSYAVASEPTYTAPEPQEVNINYFQNTLSPYGAWVDVADYGRCWQPTVCLVNRNWRPYSDRGRWLYTSSGWYWESDYSWGWAPFHYGRWHRDNRIGWVWSPGSTWGPSWVSWRYTDQYCGWAPLPPFTSFDGFGFRYRNAHVGFGFDFGLSADFYTFLPTSRFCDRSPHRYFLSGAHAKNIYGNSVVINNYIRGNNNVVINEGFGRDRVARASHTPVRTVALRDLPTATPPVGKAEHLEGNSLAVFRPNVKEQGTALRSRSVVSREVPAATKQIPTATKEVPATSPNAGPARGMASSPRHISSPARTQPASPTPAVKEGMTASTPATAPSPTSFPRTWTRSSTVTRSPSASLAQQPRSAEQNAAPAAKENSQARAPGISSGVRQLPTAQTRAPLQRIAPPTIAENPRQREAAIAPQLAQPPSTIARPTLPSNRREIYHPQNNVVAPNVGRIAPSAPQPSSAAPQNFNRGGRVAQPAPQMSQPAPQLSAPQSSPQRAPAPSGGGGGGGRPDRSGRERN